MEVQQSIPAIWVYTSGGYNRPAQGFARFLSPDQQARLERIRQARLIFDNKHRQYFLDESRSQFDFPPVKVGGAWGDRIVQLYLTYNLCRLVSIKSADLLFGAHPSFRVPDPHQLAALQALIERSGLHTLLHAKAVDCSYEAEAYLEAVIQDDGSVYLVDVPADEVFPRGVPRPDRQYRVYDRYTVATIGPATQPIYLLLQQTYSPGRIDRQLWQLDDEGKKDRRLALDQWPQDQTQITPEDTTFTRIEDNTITFVPNLLSRGKPVSDYDAAVELQDELNAKQTQIARVLAKHSDPKLAVPRTAANELGGMRADHDLVYVESKEEIPTYVVWNAELRAAIEDRDFVENALLISQEMSPVLLGIRKTGSSHAESFKKVRLEAYNSITKAARKAAYWKDALKRALRVAQALENTLPGVRYDQGPIGVELQDGIPVDDLDQANRQATLRAAGLISIHRALEEQLGDPAAVEAEEQELARENAAATPSILVGAPGQTLPGKPTDGAPPLSEGEEEAAAEGAEADQTEVAA